MALRGQLYRQVLDVLRQEITNGRYANHLPSEKELQARFGVSATTIKTALAVLVQERRIVRIPGKGTFVQDAEDPAASPGDGLDALRPNGTVPKRIGIILPTLRGAIFTHLLFSMLHEIAQYGWYPWLALSGSDKERERKIIQDYRQANIDGLLVWPAEGEQYNEELIQWHLSGFPIVLVDRWLPGFDVACVRSDHRLGARLAVEHLRELGHQHIALVTMGSEDPEHTLSIQERRTGFLEESLLTPAKSVSPQVWIRRYESGVTMSDHIQWLAEQLSEHPEITAAVGVETYDMECLRLAAERMPLPIPERLSVMGFDGGDLESDLARGWVSYFSSKKWTWIDQSESEIGREAVHLLRDHMEAGGPTHGASHSRVYAPVVRLGETTGPAPR